MSSYASCGSSLFSSFALYTFSVILSVLSYGPIVYSHVVSLSDFSILSFVIYGGSVALSLSIATVGSIVFISAVSSVSFRA